MPTLDAGRSRAHVMGTIAAGTSVPDIEVTSWSPKHTPDALPWPQPKLLVAIGRGLLCCCPACGKGRVFDGYLRVVPACSVCGAPLGSARADDAPPYFTILVVGHIVVLGMVVVERAYRPALWVHAVIWLPLTLALALLLLRPIKGATVGLMLTLGMLKPDDEV
jgi:uncharacterized protein (DUF983 family)